MRGISLEKTGIFTIVDGSEAREVCRQDVTAIAICICYTEYIGSCESEIIVEVHSGNEKGIYIRCHQRWMEALRKNTDAY